jgi:hypothetical protein
MRLASKLLSAVFTLSTLSLIGCGGVEGLEASEFEATAGQEDMATSSQALDATAAEAAVKQIVAFAPKSLPSSTPDAIAQFTANGVTYDLRILLTRSTRPFARIVSAYNTAYTPLQPQPLGTSTNRVAPPYPVCAFPSQTYQCRPNAAGTGYEWTFTQPEAGLVPITTQAVSSLNELILDHFRYPGGISYGTFTPPAGPAWRISAPALNGGEPTAGQRTFVGALEASVPNGTNNIPLLRVRNVARIDSGITEDPFSRTNTANNQIGYLLRLNTTLGTAPSPLSGCFGAANAGRTQRVYYWTEYYFVNVFLP